MFSYYGFGINFRDLVRLKQENLSLDSLHYKREKTEKELVLPRLGQLDSIIVIMKDNLLMGEDGYIFPYLNAFHKTEIQKYNRTTKCLKKYNSDLKQIASICGINSNITSYSARHSMANSLNSNHVNIAYIQQVMGHNDAKVTQAYLKNFDVQKTKSAVEGKL